LLIRADATQEIGMGHVMRSLALAQAWRRRGGDVTFASDIADAALRSRIERAGMHVVSPRADGGLEIVRSRRWAWVVTDGYHLDADYRAGIRATGHRVLVIGDTANQDLGEADAVLNQNAGAELIELSVPRETLLLLGSAYALLREELLPLRREPASRPEEARRVVVTFGGGDYGNASAFALRALGRLSDCTLELRVLIGPLNPHRAALEVLAHQMSVLCTVVAADDVGAHFAWADLALTAAGSTCWELCYVGVPIVAVRTAENQTVVERGLSAARAAVTLGPVAELRQEDLAATIHGLLRDRSQRFALASAGQRLIDGCGSSRVVDALLAAS
jgi:UDP-2,4-diacetamido-2,4,6-trideoxy-beta-L-altropyranose hydrolase